MALHRVAVQLAPTAIEDVAAHLSKASRTVIAVLRHDRHEQHYDGPYPDIFVWVKGRVQVTVAQVQAAYLQRCDDLATDAHIAP